MEWMLAATLMVQANLGTWVIGDQENGRCLASHFVEVESGSGYNNTNYDINIAMLYDSKGYLEFRKNYFPDDDLYANTNEISHIVLRTSDAAKIATHDAEIQEMKMQSPERSVLIAQPVLSASEQIQTYAWCSDSQIGNNPCVSKATLERHQEIISQLAGTERLDLVDEQARVLDRISAPGVGKAAKSLQSCRTASASGQEYRDVINMDD